MLCTTFLLSFAVLPQVEAQPTARQRYQAVLDRLNQAQALEFEVFYQADELDWLAEEPGEKIQYLIQGRVARGAAGRMDVLNFSGKLEFRVVGDGEKVALLSFEDQLAVIHGGDFRHEQVFNLSPFQQWLGASDLEPDAIESLSSSADLPLLHGLKLQFGKISETLWVDSEHRIVAARYFEPDEDIGDTQEYLCFPSMTYIPEANEAEFIQSIPNDFEEVDMSILGGAFDAFEEEEEDEEPEVEEPEEEPEAFFGWTIFGLRKIRRAILW
ncbi:MAG: hypothetical protein DWQ01_06990 [Planctomycetota bacterium]|nr:MAG: hypothetical protein DWQ01_06990 [Planctomycetota bacterium]